MTDTPRQIPAVHSAIDPAAGQPAAEEPEVALAATQSDVIQEPETGGQLARAWQRAGQGSRVWPS
jgi:hypothetical protein